MNLLTISSYMPQAIPALRAFLVNLILSPLNIVKGPSYFTIWLKVFKKLLNFEGSNCILVLIVSNGAVIVVAKLAEVKALSALTVVEVAVVKFPFLSW